MSPSARQWSLPALTSATSAIGWFTPTLLVPLSHVIFRSSYINDAKAICEKAHRVGAHVILDTFQSLGSGVPVDVRELNVDFVCGRDHSLKSA
jgi:selenocysteine lyase/cysteine desulfurase